MDRLLKFFKSERKLYITSILIILVWVSPYFILGQNAHLLVLDNLDSNLAWYKILNNSGQMFGSVNANIPQIINGELSRNALYSQFYGIVILFSLLPPMVAYGINQLIVRLFAFIGMHLLLKQHVLKTNDLGSSFIKIGVALTFALTPFWPSGMLSILGMPLALWAFLNIRNGDRSWKNIITITLLPLYSTFMLGFFFFLSALGILWLVDFIRTKKWQPRFFFSILYMTIIYGLIEYRLFVSLLQPHELTNRSEFLESTLNLVQTLKLVITNYVVGSNQDQVLFGIVIMPLSLLALMIILKRGEARNYKLFLGLQLFNFLLSVWFAFWFYKGWEPLKEHISILTTFNFSRYHYLRPIMIYVLFALTLKYFWEHGPKWRKVAIIGVVLQFIVLIPSNEQILYYNQPTYKQFFSVQQFQDIKDYIGEPVSQYRVVSIGIHPDIAQYNGFYTLDTYNNFYPLTYKHQFREIIAAELDKNQQLEKYFDQWGGRCYIFSDELGKNYMYSKYSDKTIKNLDLNTQALKDMGGDYVLSAVPILNADQNHLKLEKVFNEKFAYWEIYLYKVM